MLFLFSFSFVSSYALAVIGGEEGDPPTLKTERLSSLLVSLHYIIQSLANGLKMALEALLESIKFWKSMPPNLIPYETASYCPYIHKHLNPPLLPPSPYNVVTSPMTIDIT